MITNTYCLDRITRVIESVVSPTQLPMARDYCNRLVAYSKSDIWGSQEMFDFISRLIVSQDKALQHLQK